MLKNIVFPQTKRCFSDARNWAQNQCGSFSLARAHPKPSHLGRPASGGLHTGHRKAQKYRNTGCGCTSPAAAKGRRRSGPVRREREPAGEIQSQPPPKRCTETPLSPQSNRQLSPWCRRRRLRTLAAPSAFAASLPNRLDNSSLGYRKCLPPLLDC